MANRDHTRLCLPEAYRVRREASECLSDSGARLLLAEAVLVALTPFILFFLLPSVLNYVILPAFPETSVMPHIFSYAVAAFLWLYLLFFAIPMLLGPVWMASLLERGESAVLADVFWAFSSRRAYRRALRLSYGFFWRFGISFVILRGLFVLLSLVLRATETRFYLWLPLGVLLLLGVGFLLFTISLSAFPNAWREMTPEGAARDADGARLHRRVRAGLHFFFGYMPSILLSILSVGVLLPADTLPKMLLAYFRYCRRWNELTIRSEEHRDE